MGVGTSYLSTGIVGADIANMRSEANPTFPSTISITKQTPFFCNMELTLSGLLHLLALMSTASHTLKIRQI
ncbi:MAG: hypothetical protein LBC12_03100 [Nitrososphaerota archaeon]|nr:hypothetical protein [Nitrososphaerota archaeon]